MNKRRFFGPGFKSFENALAAYRDLWSGGTAVELVRHPRTMKWYVLVRLLVVAIVLAATSVHAAEQQRLYDSQGRSAGSVVHNPATGSEVYYDAQGRRVGASTTDSSGSTTFYDAAGRVTGRSSRPSR